MPSAKRRRGDVEHAGSRAAKRQDRSAKPQEQRLYLIFDDWPWGYSIRELDLWPPTSRQTTGTSGKGGAVRSLPEAFISLEAPRGHALHFAAVGTRIVATHRRRAFTDDLLSDPFVPIVDVRSRGVTFGPGQVYPDVPFYLPVGAGLFALDTCNFRMLSLEPLCPPRLETLRSSDDNGWSWTDLPDPPFHRVDVSSYAVHADELTILVSTEDSYTIAVQREAEEEGIVPVSSIDSDATAATFTFDTRALAWKRHSEWTPPFHGRAHFVHSLNAYVGLSKDLATEGHLCACEAVAPAATGGPPAWKLSKEKLFSEDPAETHVGATLLYMGRSEFCLVQCVSVIGDGNTDDSEQLEEEGDGISDDQEQQPEEADATADDQGQLDGTTDQEKVEEGGEMPRCTSYTYRLTTFSLGYDSNGDLTTGESCRVQSYKVPEGTTEQFFHNDPVAFWL